MCIISSTGYITSSGGTLFHLEDKLLYLGVYYLIYRNNVSSQGTLYRLQLHYFVVRIHIHLQGALFRMQVCYFVCWLYYYSCRYIICLVFCRQVNYPTCVIQYSVCRIYYIPTSSAGKITLSACIHILFGHIISSACI